MSVEVRLGHLRNYVFFLSFCTSRFGDVFWHYVAPREKDGHSNCWCSEATQNDVPRVTEIMIDKQAFIQQQMSERDVHVVEISHSYFFPRSSTAITHGPCEPTRRGGETVQKLITPVEWRRIFCCSGWQPNTMTENCILSRYCQASIAHAQMYACFGSWPLCRR
jgi:hypothetical protein